MELFQKLFGELLLFVYHCFDRIIINGYLSGLSRPEQVVHFFRQVIGVPILSKEVIAQRTNDYQKWVEAFAANHQIPIQWAEKGVRKKGSFEQFVGKNDLTSRQKRSWFSGVFACHKLQEFATGCVVRHMMSQLSFIIGTPKRKQRATFVVDIVQD